MDDVKDRISLSKVGSFVLIEFGFPKEVEQ